MNQNIYVTGHKHPDSDSICSAITYTELLNRTGKAAVACRQGPLNEETKFILKRFHQENPLLLTDARTMLSDIDLDLPTTIMHHDTVHHAWHLMLRTQNRSLFVVDDDGNLCGICTTSNLSDVRIHPEASIDKLMATATCSNIARTIGGSVVIEPPQFRTNGNVHIITLETISDIEHSHFEGSIVILSSGNEKQMTLLKIGVRCLVLTCGVHADMNIIRKAQETGCAIIETPYDTMHTAKVITESYSVEQIMTPKERIISFQENEYVEDVAAKMGSSRVRSYPVLNDKGDVVGAVSRYHTRNYNRRKFALVDHSAVNQSVNHIQEAEIISIVDHHHIGDIQTDRPIEYRNHRCGCTCTIISRLYEEAGIEPGSDMAGLMLSAILSDTLNLKSATVTDLDRITVKKLAEKAGIEDIDEYAREMLGASVSLLDSTPNEILYRDLKSYQIGRFSFAIGQTNYSHMEDVQRILPEFSRQLEKEQASNKLDIMVMLFTDVMGKGSYFVFYGPLSYVLSDLLETNFDEHSGFDPNIISRKQQLMPKLSSILKEM
ncbi:MAG: putative manganese-dependent inorganic diphosphatase [Erysipelotrichaceae bacterium]|nr:putative manganese-dependent inorganic diphosphatase [Erysipelotrichaceae bacterium]